MMSTYLFKIKVTDLIIQARDGRQSYEKRKYELVIRFFQGPGIQMHKFVEFDWDPKTFLRGLPDS
jgi:hypothetical protein